MMEHNSTMNGYECYSTSMRTVMQSRPKETDHSDDLKATWISTERMETWPDSADSGLGTVTDSYGYGKDSHHIKGAEFLDQLSDYWYLKQSTTNEQCTRNNW